MKECTVSFRTKVAIILFLFRLYNVAYLIIILVQSKEPSEKVHEYFKFRGGNKYKRSSSETLYRNAKRTRGIPPRVLSWILFKECLVRN